MKHIKNFLMGFIVGVGIITAVSVVIIIGFGPVSYAVKTHNPFWITMSFLWIVGWFTGIVNIFCPFVREEE